MRILLLVVSLLWISGDVSAQLVQIDSLKKWMLSPGKQETASHQMLRQIRSGNNVSLYPELSAIHDSLKLRGFSLGNNHTPDPLFAAMYQLEATLIWLDMEQKGISTNNAKLEHIFRLVHQKQQEKKIFNAELILIQDYLDNNLLLLWEKLDNTSDVRTKTILLRAMRQSDDPSIEQLLLERIDRKSYAAVYPVVLSLLNIKGGSATIRYLDKKINQRSMQRINVLKDSVSREQAAKERILWRLNHPEPFGK